MKVSYKRFLGTILMLVIGVFGVCGQVSAEGEDVKTNTDGDQCIAIKYSANGVTGSFYTRRICQNRETGALYNKDDSIKGSGPNLTVSGPSSNYVCVDYGGTNKNCTKLDDGAVLQGDFLVGVLKGGCSGDASCGGYVFNDDKIAQLRTYSTEDKPAYLNEQTGWSELETVENSSAMCYKGSGALGWILCPIIQGASGIGEYMWNQIEENHLKVPANEIFKDDGGVYKGWEVVRNVANIAFVILFMVVIFSQLTGKGIDNYGIKKILPRLIVVAILMNLSYLICELAVDLSNIVGNGLNNLLSGLAANSGGLADATSEMSQASDVSQLTGWVAATGLAGGGVALFMLLNPAGAVAAAASIGLAVLGLVITIVVAMLTLYLILVIREAGIVILIVLAPVALVCYMLPNTEKWFKKWLDLGKALLIVYPLCGLVVGGGQLAGAILGSIDSQSMKIAAMIVQVLPFFMLPFLLKRSLSLMGNIGAKVSSIGRGLGRKGSSKAQSAIKGSEAYKSMQVRSQQAAARRRTGLKFDKNGNVVKDADGNVVQKRGRIGRFLRGGTLGEAQARAQYIKDQNAATKAESLMGAGFDAALIAQKKSAEKDEVADYMTFINNQTRNGEQEDALFSMYDQYLKDDNKAGAVAVAKIAGRRKDTAARFLDEKLSGSRFDKESEQYKDMLSLNNEHRDIVRSVAKEVSTGENSGAYKDASPLGFEFAAQHNRFDSVDMDYNNWLEQNEDRTSGNGNIHRAVENYLTNSRELVGTKNSSLKEIANLMESGKMDDTDKRRLQNLARETINNRGTTGVWDTTKAENIYRIANGGVPVKMGGEVVQPTTESDFNEALKHRRDGVQGGRKPDGSGDSGSILLR